MAFGLRKLLPMGLLALACALPVQAADVGGVKVPDTVTLAGKELKLNGAGMRAILFIKFYAIGMYLPEKKTTVADVMAVTGPRRFELHIQRKMDSDELGQLFIKAMNNNSTKEEKAKVIAQTVKFGEVFASIESINKGDVMFLDWVPGKGTVAGINGKQLGETMPDIAFFNALSRIWLGDMPAQESVKRELLGGK